jgi:uncharacterized protein DUF4349
MRVQRMAGGLLLVALMMGCGKRTSTDNGESRDQAASNQPSSPVRLGQMGKVAQLERDAAAPSSAGADEWAHADPFDAASQLIVRTGQASIEVDSLEASMANLRRLVLRVGGFVADASVQSGRNQLRSATLQLKVPAARFDDLTEGLSPLGKVQFVNVGAQDVSEEFVDLTARVANGHRLEERLIELLRTRTGKLQDVLQVERELARVREEIERMEGRLRFLKTRSQLSTLSVNLFEPAPIIASHPGESVLGEAFKTAWRNFVGVLAGGIASLGFVVPIVVLGWGAIMLGKRYKRGRAVPELSS